MKTKWIIGGAAFGAVVLAVIILIVLKPWRSGGGDTYVCNQVTGTCDLSSEGTKSKSECSASCKASAPDVQDTGLAVGSKPPTIACWAWNSLVTGGFMGFGIFANKSGGYTWENKANGAAIGNGNADKGVKWDSQFQNTRATYARATDLNIVDSGSQFWDLISKQGSYLNEYGRRSMDAIKIQYDADTQMDMTKRYIDLIKNLLGEGLLVAILIGGKPNADGSAYHGIPYTYMEIQIDKATDWIDSNKLGDKVYIALDIEPADKILDNTDMTGDYSWYDSIFSKVATKIRSHKGKDVYYGMAINKNPYQSTLAHDAWQKIMASNWKSKSGAERGFRVIELMYWWTAVDSKGSTGNTHLQSQLETKGTGVNDTPVSDAVRNGCYLQFGMECTGEVDFLAYVPVKQPASCPDTGCGTLASPAPAPCYRGQKGVLFVDDNIGYSCNNKDATLANGQQAFTTSMKGDSKAEYWNTLKFTGSQKDYAPVYGYPFIPTWMTEAKGKYGTHACNALGSVVSNGSTEDPEPQGQPGPPKCTVAGRSWKSCDFLNKESWLLGGALTDESLEKYLHSQAALEWVAGVVAAVLPKTLKDAEAAKKYIFKVPFCIEDMSGYSGWLHNFKYGSRDKAKTKPELANFPDSAITSLSPAGSICQSRIQSDGTVLGQGEYKGSYQVNVPCLGQTALTQSGSHLAADWVAGTLEYKDGQWDCPADKYLFNYDCSVNAECKGAAGDTPVCVGPDSLLPSGSDSCVYCPGLNKTCTIKHK